MSHEAAIEEHSNKPAPEKEHIVGRFLYTGRWVLAYFYVGLQLALVWYAYRYSLELYHLFTDKLDQDDAFMLAILGLVDMVMIANLIDMIKSGSYAVFIQRFHPREKTNCPQWLDHMSSGLQKVKMSASILGISSVHLLKSFIDIQSDSWEHVYHQIIIHCVFIIGTVLLAVTEWVCKATPVASIHDQNNKHEAH